MKTLELTIYPEWRGYYREHDGSPLASYVAVDAYSRAKRLTDAELAAEVWKQEVSIATVIATGGTPIRTLAKVETLERFATLPSAV